MAKPIITFVTRMTRELILVHVWGSILDYPVHVFGIEECVTVVIKQSAGLWTPLPKPQYVFHYIWTGVLLM